MSENWTCPEPGRFVLISDYENIFLQVRSQGALLESPSAFDGHLQKCFVKKSPKDQVSGIGHQVRAPSKVFFIH